MTLPEVGVTISAAMTDKLSRYRKLAQSLAEIGDNHSKAILTLLFFLGNVCILENLDLAPLDILMREFDEAGKQSQ